MKHIISLLFLTVFIACGKAENTDNVTVAAASVEKAVIKIPTAICNECAGTIKKAVAKVNGVNDVKIDVKAKTATIEFISTSVKFADLEHTIVMAGYDANDKKADQEAYEKLPDCCKK